MPKDKSKANKQARNPTAKNGRMDAGSNPQVRSVAARAPVAISTNISRSDSAPAYRVVRKEYVGDVSGSVTFANTSYAFNPGMANLFPWLSNIANAYEEYHVDNVMFHYEPSQATTATGSVMLSFDYDSLDAAPADKNDALLNSSYVRSSPWDRATMALRKVDIDQRQGNALFTRNATISGSDLKTYDLGQLHVSTVGQANTAIIGELWISYSIALRVPQRAKSEGCKLASTGSALYSTVVSTGSVYASGSGQVLTFAVPGYYLVAQAVTATGIGAGSDPTASTGSSVTILNTFTYSTTNVLRLLLVRMLAGGTLTCSYTGTISASDTYIAPYFYV